MIRLYLQTPHKMYLQLLLLIGFIIIALLITTRILITSLIMQEPIRLP